MEAIEQISSATKGFRIPSYRRHRPSNQGVVTLSGVDHYLGRWRSSESQQRYERLIQEWLANGRVLPAKTTIIGEQPQVLVKELMAAYWRHCVDYYKESGRAKKAIRPALRPVRELYGDIAVADFGPLALKAVRQKMVEGAIARTEVNRRVGIVRGMFKWGVGQEIVAPSVLQALQAVDGLKRGRSAARETKPVSPVPEPDMRAALPFMLPQVGAMVELMWLAGMRPGEVVLLRGADLDMSGPVWLYQPGSHKTAWRGKDRSVALGPRAQEVIRPYLKLDPHAWLFSPKEAETAWRESKTTSGMGSRKRRRCPRRKPGDMYSTSSLGRAVRRACERACVQPFGANRLRHSCATRLRKELGSLELVSTVLGHSDPRTSLIYAERDVAKAVEIMGKLG